MKRIYIKPLTVATVLENECELMAGSTFNVGVNENKTITSDGDVGAKQHSGPGLWDDFEE